MRAFERAAGCGVRGLLGAARGDLQLHATSVVKIHQSVRCSCHMAKCQADGKQMPEAWTR